MTETWLETAPQRYDACNRAMLDWILARDPLHGAFVDTKVNAITGEDYSDQSALRGPSYTYGWIQGRALEALTTFALHYRDEDPELAQRLNDRAALLFGGVKKLFDRDGHLYFLYNQQLEPIRKTDSGAKPQSPAGQVFTYSDAFAAKGLFAASCLFAPKDTPIYLKYLMDVIAAIEDNRFQMNEAVPIGPDSVQSEPDDFGPRMILLGAAGVLHRNGQSESTGFADRFIDHVLDRHYAPESGLLLNIPGDDTCNVGHAIEFCGFAFEHLLHRPDDDCIPQLCAILQRSLDAGLQGPGIALSLSAKSGAAISPYYPWWPMPEAARACALSLRLGAGTEIMELWRRADDAFFDNYWQADHSYAYQTRTIDGPFDFVPATPDLDPAYHTGLSFLTAAETTKELLRG